MIVNKLNLILCVVFLSITTACGSASIEDQSKRKTNDTEEPKGVNNLAYKWGQVALQATAFDTERYTPRPTITSRSLGLIFTAIFDAWSRYDEKAEPVYLRNVERRPEEEFNLANKEKAISYAAFQTLKQYYPKDSSYFIDFMKELGYDPMNETTDPNKAAGVGNSAARAVIEARKGDGANQYGEEPASEKSPFFDYTNYKPVNTADSLVDIMRWQPKYFLNSKGGYYAPGCLTPHWASVEPITLDSANQFRPGPPPAKNSKQLVNEVREVIDFQSSLDDEKMGLVEFMRDGPKSVQQAGHWLIFAQDVSERDEHTLDQDVKMYFLNQIVAMDAFIACWDAKMYYDYARPYALIHHYFEDTTFWGWAGKGKGMMELKGADWQPYSPAEFLCPAFPSYPSGHSSISGACSEVLKLWTGDDFFGIEVERVANALTDPQNLGDTVTIKFNTFTETAEKAGISRVYGGYHIQADNIAGLEMGRKIAHNAYEFYKKKVGEK
jgi:hypothetical protein